jgi:membrane-associated phospholipid phosphatase
MPRRSTRALIVLACFALVSGSVTAHAQEREIALTMPHYGYGIAYFVVGATLGFTGTYAITPREGDIAPLDGRGHHVFQHRADVASDVFLYMTSYGVPIIAYFLDATRDRNYVRALRVPIVLMESFAMTSGITGLMKNLGVCRPYAWQPETQTCSDGTGLPGSADDQRRSFPSGHSSSTASIAGGLMGMWLLPRARDHRLAPIALGATVLSLTTASLRIRAGAHSFADTSVGLAIGFGVGLSTAALHLRRRPLPVQIAPTANGFVLHGRF